jgi:hypothetical protein
MARSVGIRQQLKNAPDSAGRLHAVLDGCGTNHTLAMQTEENTPFQRFYSYSLVYWRF